MAKWDGVQPAVHRWRFNPFTETSQYITLAAWETTDIVGDTHTVALDAQGNQTIQAREAIYDDGAILLQYFMGAWLDAIEVDFAPTAVGQFRVDYKYKTGKIQFHVGMNGMDIRLKYTAMGTIVAADPLVNKIIEQDSLYGHEWMFFEEETHEILPLVFGSYNILFWYFPILVNPDHGKYGHWPIRKYRNDDDTDITIWASIGQSLLWGGQSGDTPGLAYVYVAGVLLNNVGGPNKDRDVHLQVNMHGD
tara:strand:+ start:277 stop:1023 length:747 start_codon:yes stop_codon:yes gene_type:complete